MSLSIVGKITLHCGNGSVMNGVESWFEWPARIKRTAVMFLYISHTREPASMMVTWKPFTLTKELKYCLSTGEAEQW